MAAYSSPGALAIAQVGWAAATRHAGFFSAAIITYYKADADVAPVDTR